MSMHNKHKQYGFTIVELLIVIVVIGILASITIVAYNGIQAKSKVAKKESEIGAVQKKMEMYRIANDTFPATGSTILTSAEIDAGISKNTVISDEVWNCNSPTTLSKSQYCIGSDGDRYIVFWWNDVTKQWNLSYHDESSIYTNDANGSGDRPNGLIN